MPVQKRIVILANSRKSASRCVAGLEIRNRRAQDWLRPVDDHKGTVANYHRVYEDGTEPVPGDVASLSLHGPEQRDDHQQENWSLDTSVRWRKDGALTWPQLRSLPMSDEPLWPDQSAGDSNFGIDNRVRLSRARTMSTSLRLIRAPRLQLHIVGGRRDRLDGSFRLGSNKYRLSVTDALYERMYYTAPPGVVGLGECLLTISLGESFAGYCYKLIAGIIERERYEQI